jgi:hypothetical protein
MLLHGDLRGWFFPKPRKESKSMASLESHYGKYRIVFRFAGQKYSQSLKTNNERLALATLARVDDNLARLEMGQLEPPAEADLVTFLLSDGRMEQQLDGGTERRPRSRQQQNLPLHTRNRSVAQQQRRQDSEHRVRRRVGRLRVARRVLRPEGLKLWHLSAGPLRGQSPRVGEAKSPTIAVPDRGLDQGHQYRRRIGRLQVEA